MKKHYMTALIMAGTIGSASAASFAINFGNNIDAPGNGSSSSLTQTTFTNVDFDNNSSGDVWNNVGSLAANTAIGNNTRGYIQDLTGANTAYTVSISGFAGLNNNEAAPTTAAWNDALDVEHVKEAGGILSSIYFANPNATASVTFGGFNANESGITVEIFNVFNSGGATPTTYTIGGVDQDITRNEFFTSSDPEDARTVFTGVAANASGFISISMQGNSAPVAAIRISPVPEPSSAALLGLGGLAFILRRRK